MSRERTDDMAVLEGDNAGLVNAFDNERRTTDVELTPRVRGPWLPTCGPCPPVSGTPPCELAACMADDERPEPAVVSSQCPPPQPDDMPVVQQQLDDAEPLIMLTSSPESQASSGTTIATNGRIMTMYSIRNVVLKLL